MNLQQLEYIIALDVYKGFVLAAEKCFVTQSTLSIMVKKLEEELGVVLFDRTKQPVTATEIGSKVIRQAKIILHEVKKLDSLIVEETQHLYGNYSLGIIPTLAPYLLPLFIESFLKKHPEITLQVFEMTTDIIIQKLINRELDAGILAIPVLHPDIVEHPVFKEEFVVYAPDNKRYEQKKFILANEIDTDNLWLLEEGHCLRQQVINLCELKEKEKKNHPLNFSAGSIETLKRLVEVNKGITILPYLGIDFLSDKEMQHIYFFEQPAPEREIGIVTHKYFVKNIFLKALKDEIIHVLPPSCKKNELPLL